MRQCCCHGVQTGAGDNDFQGFPQAGPDLRLVCPLPFQGCFSGFGQFGCHVVRQMRPDEQMDIFFGADDVSGLFPFYAQRHQGTENLGMFHRDGIAAEHSPQAHHITGFSDLLQAFRFSGGQDQLTAFCLFMTAPECEMGAVFQMCPGNVLLCRSQKAVRTGRS